VLTTARGVGASLAPTRTDIHFSFNPDWEVTGPARSLSLVPLASQSATFVRYSDMLFRPDAVRRLESFASDVVLAVDSRWPVRYDGRSRAELDSAEKLQLDGDLLGRTVYSVGTSGRAGAEHISGLVDAETSWFATLRAATLPP
jgi:choline kinase